MNRKKEFAKNTIILFVGKFATQFMSILLLPFFTHYLLADDYGYVDLLQTYILLFVPVLTLRLDSSTFRFLIDVRNDNNKQQKIITNTLLILSFSTIITILAFFVFGLFVSFKYYTYLVLNVIILMFTNVFMQIIRGLGKIKFYSIISAVTGFVTLVSNIVLILFFRMTANSILISSIIANIFCLLCIFIKVNIFSFIDTNKICKNTIKNILKFSIPMIPNSLSWWVVNVSDRTIITHFIGTAFNGVYTVSCKFSNILNSIFSIFGMSWQETASVHINDNDSCEFFSNMINQLIIFFGSIALLIQVMIPLFFDFMIGNEYIDSFNYIPILLYSNIWNVIINLYGGIYLSLKRTKEIANTTIISAIINLIVHLLLIKFIGLYAACVSTLISYMVMGIYRSIDIKKYLNIKLDIKLLFYILII